MINMNYSILEKETQKRLLTRSKNHIEKKYGVALKIYALKNQLEYQRLLEEEAQRNPYNFKFVFKV